MKRVFQSRIEKKHGTCEQAAVASLFEMFIDDVPNFIELGDKWYYALVNFYNDKGYGHICEFNPKGRSHLVKQVLEHDGGVNGYWEATVESICLGPGTTHAVIIDKDMNVVHDPNPNNFGHTYKPEDIISICTVKDDWHIDLDGQLKIEEKED
jgi:hypothetical protein